MQLTRLVTEDDAVSPVIGVILMVAITVIMAAVTGAFVLSLQSDVSVSPTTSWDTSSADTSGSGHVDLVEIRHRAGDGIDAEELSVRIPGQPPESVGDDERVQVGDVIRVELDDSSQNPAGDELLLVWQEDGSGDSVILTSHRFLEDYGDSFDDVQIE